MSGDEACDYMALNIVWRLRTREGVASKTTLCIHYCASFGLPSPLMLYPQCPIINYWVGFRFTANSAARHGHI